MIQESFLKTWIIFPTSSYHILHDLFPFNLGERSEVSKSPSSAFLLLCKFRLTMAECKNKLLVKTPLASHCPSGLPFLHFFFLSSEYLKTYFKNIWINEFLTQVWIMNLLTWLQILWEQNCSEASGQCKTAPLLSQLIYLLGTANALITTYLVSFVILEFLKCPWTCSNPPNMSHTAWCSNKSQSRHSRTHPFLFAWKLDFKNIKMKTRFIDRFHKMPLYQ